VEGGGCGGGGCRRILRAHKALGDVAELELAGERTDRMDREADSLHAEISRLARANRESTALLGAMPNQHLRSSGKTAPLPLQVRRFEQELDAVSFHSNYLDGKSNRNDKIGSLKCDHLV